MAQKVQIMSLSAQTQRVLPHDYFTFFGGNWVGTEMTRIMNVSALSVKLCDLKGAVDQSVF